MKDGKFTYYEIQHKTDGKWGGSNLDVFGYTDTFYTAWDKIGISQASINKVKAIKGLIEISDNNPDHQFRLVEVKATKETKTIVTMGE